MNFSNLALAIPLESSLMEELYKHEWSDLFCKKYSFAPKEKDFFLEKSFVLPHLSECQNIPIVL